jgi:DNA-3-methyladenine glycosylase II
MTFTPLTNETLARAARILARRDKDLARVVKLYGVPPMWDRPANFATLLYIILEQQVSLASARAAFNKLKTELGEVMPENFLSLDDARLKAIGFSRQKMRYGRGLADAVLSGSLDISALKKMSDDDVRANLTAITGIGDWTADVFLLMVLLRPDILPKGDLALLIALQYLKGLKSRPTHEQFIKIAEPWRPYRAVGARLLWHFYLSKRKENASQHL